MDNDTYLVLRVTGAERETYDPLTGTEWRSDTPPESATELAYSVEAQALDQLLHPLLPFGLGGLLLGDGVLGLALDDGTGHKEMMEGLG